jgi:DNA polymerase V
MDSLKINAKTTGFSSPAESYVDSRLDMNELITPNPYATFYFRYKGPTIYGIKENNIVVVDRSIDPVFNELIVVTTTSGFAIERYVNQANLWGRISWVLKKQ